MTARCGAPRSAGALLAALAALHSLLPAQEESGQQSTQREYPNQYIRPESRWFAPGWPVRSTGPLVQPPEYVINEAGHRWNSYRQHPLKGDFPVLGTEDLFLSVSGTQRLIFEQRNLPTPTLTTGPQGSIVQSFFGRGEQSFVNLDLAISFDLFKGQQAFQPVDWRVKITPVFNMNYLGVEEVGIVNINAGNGDDRTTSHLSLQEAFVEYHLSDLTDRYDFISVEAGILPFRSDFRGFIFDDVQRGVRLFGNYDNNLWQYNLAVFDTLNKDTNSQLNDFEDRDQLVVVANVYRQDWPVLGHSTELSFHYNRDNRGQFFDDNGFLVAPAPIGAFTENEVEAYYVGIAGEGHFGRLNITHALYQAFGNESANALAGRDVSINAQLAAIELSYDIDWWRPRVFGLYQSGDDDTRDGSANGFDAILDAPNFAGGEFSFWNRQSVRLYGVGLSQPQSPLVDLSTSKTEGQANFVNPGLLLLGGAVDFEWTPRLRMQTGLSYLAFAETDTLEDLTQVPDVKRELGIDLFIGAQYRPWLNNEVIFQVGANALLPDEGFTRIYQSDETLYSVFFTSILTW